MTKIHRSIRPQTSALPLFFLALCLCLGHNARAQAPVRSLLGNDLGVPEWTAERQSQLSSALAAAERELQQKPDESIRHIWVGRRQAYLWRYHDAIKTFSMAIERFPNEPRLYRHRGHRYITIRKFDLAIKDLRRAAKLIEGNQDIVEPDGQPNAAGIPTSTLHTNIWYHLGLAYYLKRDYQQALGSYQKCLAASKNNDMKVATLDWMWMTLMRLGRDGEAQQLIEDIGPKLKIIENTAYHRRILLYRGLLKESDLLSKDAGTVSDLDIATYGYGIGNWHQVHGRQEQATKLYRKVVVGKYWSAFGYLAAEADLADMKRQQQP